jgi:Ca-activated chloride channel family protein
MPVDENIYRKRIFLLTDGGVAQPENVIKLIHDNINKGNVHTFGLGSGCDKTLVERAARAGQGSCSLVRDTNNLKVNVISALEKA